MSHERQPSATTTEAAAVRTLCLFAADSFPVTPAAAATTGTDLDHGDVAVARAERALRSRLPGHRAGPGCWAAAAERLPRGLRLRVADASDAADEVVMTIEEIARACGLALWDEALEETVYPTTLDREGDLLEAARALVRAGDGYLLCEGGPDDAYFLQAFAANSDRRVVVEAVGNSTLPVARRLPRARLADLRRQGWQPPRRRQPYYSRELDLELALERIDGQASSDREHI